MATTLRWPPVCPQVMPLDTEEEPDDNRVITEIDGGPNKVRQRYTAKSVFLRPPGWVFKVYQAEALMYFYETVTKDGSLTFNWIRPTMRLTGDRECRFEGIPKIRPITPGRGRLYSVSLVIEVLP